MMNEQSIKSFLGKPVLLIDGLLSTTDAVSTFSQYQIPASILGLSSLFTDKLRGFYGFRATTVLTLQVNATRFIQGRYLLNFYPTCGSIDGGSAALKVAFHNFSLMQRTQVPGVQIDLNCETQVTLRIPFVSAYAYYPLRANTMGAGIRSIGTVQLHPYVATSAPCSFTIYSHFEDIDLIGATVPQSALEAEQKSKDMGTVETNLRKLSLTTKYASRLPLIGDTLRSMGWVSDIAANIASVWGWSKPTSNDNPKPIVRHRAYQSMNVDGADISTKMSFSCKNEVAQVDGLLGSNIDEMSFNYIQSIPSWFRTDTWNTSQTKETLLVNFISLNPTNFFNTYTDNGNTVYGVAPCAIPAVNFNLYRGSFNLTLKVVKTEFHSGRLVIVFVPGSNDGNLSYPASFNSYANSYYCHRHIIDIRYGNEWTFNFPWISESLYKNVSSNYGAVLVFIENPLVAPATVSSSVTLLWEVSGGSDLEYAQPAPTAYFPYSPTAPQSANGGQFACDKVEEVIGTAIPSIENTTQAALAIGEKMTSYRQLLKRFEMRGRISAIPADVYYSVIPYFMSAVNGVGTAGSPAFPNCSPDAIARVGHMYALARGSMRVKLMDLKPSGQGSCIAYSTSNVTTVANEYVANPVDNKGQSGPLPMWGNPVGYITVNDGLSAEVQTPMYSTSFAFPMGDVTSTNLRLYDARMSAPDVAFNFTNIAVTGNAPMYLRAIGDDFSFGYFISTVPLIASTTAYVTNFT
jgi:hypothetical protein